MNTTENSLVEKIVKLMSLGADGGATLGEQKAAMAMAQKLMTKYGIELADVEAAAAAAEGRRTQNWNIKSDVVVCDRQQRYDFDQNVAMILQHCFGVKILWSTRLHRYTHRAKGEVSARCHTYVIIGTELDVQIAKMVIPLLLSAMREGINKLLSDRAKARGENRKEKWTAAVGRAYYDGLTTGYIQGSDQGKANAYREASKEKADAYAIVLVDKSKAIEKWTEANMTVTDAKRGKRDMSDFDWAAYHRGVAEGKTLDLSGSKLNDRQP